MSAETPTIPYSTPLKNIDGDAVTLEPYRGKTLLIVNTASKCGYTKQYPALQALHEKYGARGLVVLGFPSNDFFSQEPGSDKQIKSFCTTNYHVTFPMFAKNPVKGSGKQPLYAWLTEHAPETETGEVKWNFEKFLVASDGRVVARFRSGTEPDSAEVIKAIEAALAKPAKM